MESSLFLSDLLTGHEPALLPERELSQLAALRQATRVGRFSARANIRAAVWDKPRSSLRRPEERDSWEAPTASRAAHWDHEPKRAGLETGAPVHGGPG
jgi:hypothetical protein